MWLLNNARNIRIGPGPGNLLPDQDFGRIACSEAKSVPTTTAPPPKKDLQHPAHFAMPKDKS